ncbi:conserved uncharacterized protein, DUF2867 [Desulfosarcina variabilis str. Montpellier]|uniref:SDR family oxidoreductase n=1 Tax=Desulfosarcina variabilis TaxID=2300 RepID=UPI003AFA5357
MTANRSILVTGGTGYVGGRLIPMLLDRGYRVRAMVRSPQKLLARPWAGHPALDILPGDALDQASFIQAGEDCDTAYYLIHSMNAHKRRFAEADRKAAENMVACAEQNGMQRIIYLGGLGDKDHENLSHHLRSRHEVEGILEAGRVPVTNLRAAMILGSGSASFEMLRYLVERLPIMITPRWLRTPCQPIAISNVLDYLAGCLSAPQTTGKTLDIGGPDILNYQDLIDIYCRVAGLPKRIIISVPVLTPWLSAKWIHLVTPVPASIAQPLAEGLSIPVICKEDMIREWVPVKLFSCEEAIRTALKRVQQEQVDTCCFDGGGQLPPEWTTCGDADYAGGTVMRRGYRIAFEGEISKVWEAIEAVGGRNGWYFAQSLWRLRGMLDRMVGGPGLMRGRRHSQKLRTGDALDFWRVVAHEPPRRLLLLSEMKAPGDALLEFRIHSKSQGQVRLEMVSRFLPKGFSGIAYWYGMLPIHDWLFKGVLVQIARKFGDSPTGSPHVFSVEKELECKL